MLGLCCHAQAFSSCSKWGPSVGFSLWLFLWITASWACGLQELRCMGLAAPWHVGFSRTKDWTRVPCIGRRILTTVPLGKPFAIYWKYIGCVSLAGFITGTSYFCCCKCYLKKNTVFFSVISTQKLTDSCMLILNLLPYTYYSSLNMSLSELWKMVKNREAWVGQKLATE